MTFRQGQVMQNRDPGMLKEMALRSCLASSSETVPQSASRATSTGFARDMNPKTSCAGIVSYAEAWWAHVSACSLMVSAPASLLELSSVLSQKEAL